LKAVSSNFTQIISKVLGRVCDPFLKPSQWFSKISLKRHQNPWFLHVASISNDGLLDRDFRNRKIKIIKQICSHRQNELFKMMINKWTLFPTMSYFRFGKVEIAKQLLSQGAGTGYRDLVSSFRSLYCII
jgi:hypothetical protein